jgi:hypothetical protein
MVCPFLPLLSYSLRMNSSLRAVYHLVQEKIKKATGLPQHRDDTASRILEDADQGAPLLRDFSPPNSDEEVQPQSPKPRPETRIQGRRSPRR